MAGKVCCHCKIKKPLDAFYHSANGSYNRMSGCMDCYHFDRQRKKEASQRYSDLDKLFLQCIGDEWNKLSTNKVNIDCTN